MPLRAAAGRESYGELDGEVSRWFFVGGYRPNMIVTTVCLARDLAWNGPLLTAGCDKEKVDVMDYVCRYELLDSFHFRALPVEGQAMRTTLDGKTRTSAYGARKM